MRNYKSYRLLNERITYLLDRRAMRVFGVLLLVTGALIIFSTGLGEMKINPLDVFKVFFGGGTEMERLVVQTFRLPRIMVALLAGMGLAAAGGILQGMIRNPLASPDMLGITSGASVAVVAFLAFFSDKNHSLTVSIHWMPVAAFAGASVVAFLVYLLAWKNGVSPIRLVLIGIGVMSLMKALTTMMMVLGPIYQTSQANIWIIGTVYGSTWKNVAILAPWTISFLLIAFIYARNVNVQELGDDVAMGLGERVQKQRFILLLVSTALIAGSVAFAGGISFIGLMAPHMARRLVGPGFGALLPVSALLGGIMIMGADLVGRMLFSPLEIPAGVFTASIGAPYFIYLLYKTRNS
ncbi:FecCD family ABC transporter permease [Mesobacillus zeae]|uniref:Iron ABC transporter permease n=1 Tax=Mesobacillus zeae TaxID=1917180 RepID=A0A398B0S5_9BACI|nr:iron ABC transporter permease [Mesobacillus zeae]RID82904.1 iron ABC transporter permease [Mesobacillus zeae]